MKIDRTQTLEYIISAIEDKDEKGLNDDEIKLLDELYYELELAIANESYIMLNAKLRILVIMVLSDYLQRFGSCDYEYNDIAKIISMLDL